MIDARVITIKPHPDQATHNPGCWAVQFSVRYKDTTRTFWRWHTVLKLNKNGAYITPDNQPPTNDEILARFWDDEFAELHGFDFETFVDDEEGNAA